MATTKIWPIHDSLKHVVNYASNPEKTEFIDLKLVLHYAGNESKTSVSNERFCFTTGVNYWTENAYEEMRSIKEQFGKTGGNVAYHAYQSFKPWEVTPEQCHEIGVKLAQQLWGKRFQVLVTTHLDKGHLHIHFTALKICSSRQDFKQALRDMGYVLNDNPNRKYATLCRIGNKKPVRLYQLVENYDLPYIGEQLYHNRYQHGRYIHYVT